MKEIKTETTRDRGDYQDYLLIDPNKVYRGEVVARDDSDLYSCGWTSLLCVDPVSCRRSLCVSRKLA